MVPFYFPLSNQEAGKIGFDVSKVVEVLDRWVRRQTRWLPRHKATYFSWLGSELLVCCLAHRNSTAVFLLLHISVYNSKPRDLHRRTAY